MISRYGFKWILPCVMVVLNVCLFGVSIAYSTGPIIGRPPDSPGPRYIVSNPDDTETQTASFPPPLQTSAEFKIALALSMPAVIAGSLLSIFVPHMDCTLNIGLSTVFVPFLWFAIGKWFDELRSGAAFSVRKALKIGAPGRLLLRAGAGFFFLLSVFGLSTIDHHRTNESNFFFAVSLIWSCCYIAGSIWTERRSKQRVPLILY